MSDLAKRITHEQFSLIAEIGVNYYDIAAQLGMTPIEAAKLMIRKAKESGVHAVKFQTYKTDSLVIKNSPSYWDLSEEATPTQYELYKKYDSFSEAEYALLANYCKDLGISFFSTPFDMQSSDYLCEYMDVYKISSSDLTNIPLIKHIAKKNKITILSTGASNQQEISKAIDSIRQYNKKPLVLMHCVLEYPTPFEDANLRRILALKNTFKDVIIGYSDHCKIDHNYDVIKTAYSLGAHIIEKHYTLDKQLPGNDHYHSMDNEDARRIINSIDFVETISGQNSIAYQESEEAARQNARRSIVANGDIPKGAMIQEEMLEFKRPGTGISPMFLEDVLGKIALVNIPHNTIIMPEHLGMQ